MGRVRGAVWVDGIVCIAVVSDDNHFIVVSLSCFNHVFHAVVNGMHGLGNGIVDACVAHHVAVCKVHHDEVILLGVDGTHQFVFHGVCTHFGLQVIGGHFGRRHQDAVLALIRSLASAIEEEGHVSVFLSLCRVELLLAHLAEILAKCVFHVFLGEEYVHALERSVVGSHAVVVQVLDGVHAFCRHVFLGEHLGEFLGTVVAEVHEDNHVALVDGSVHLGVVDRLDELIGHVLVIAFLHGFHHVVGLLSLALYEQVVGFLHTVPALVAVHGIETADDACHVGIVLFTGLGHLLDESLAALGVGVATVHEAVHVGILQSVMLAYLEELEEMVE